MQPITVKNHWYALFIICCTLMQSAGASTDYCANESSWQQQKQDLINVNLTGIGIITAWGIVQWDYFSNSPKAGQEDWFQNNTDEGGADKMGHIYTSYVTAHGLSYLFETWCVKHKDAALYGALSSLAMLGYMEVGDSFSSYGFSSEDFIANGLGSLLGYYLYLNPELGNKVDFRWEYGLNPTISDFVTDYENSKYLFALKLNGFDSFRETFLRHIELHFGYYAHGFDDPLETRERNLYFGIGLNLTDLFRRHDYKKTATVLRYLQVPGTYIEFKKDRNK